MTTYSNPFRHRASEQQRDLRSFLRSFGPGALRLLPDAIWDRLVVLRSSAGAGKTSLMRVLTAESVAMLLDSPDSFKELTEELTKLGVLRPPHALFLGVYLNLEHNYRSLVDVGQSPSTNLRLFFRLLDVRIMAAVIKAALVLARRRFPEDVATLQFKVVNADPAVEQAARLFGGLGGGEVYETCHAADREMLEKLDSLLPVDWNQQGIGHSELYSLRLLSNAEILINGQPLQARPLIMLDDGFRLHGEQRIALLERLADRTLGVARWYAERHQALSKQDRMGEIASNGRDLEVVDLESIARGDPTRGDTTRFKAGQFENVLVDIANRRAHRPLIHSTERQEDFFELLELEDGELLGGRSEEVLSALRERVGKLAAKDPRYDRWLADALANAVAYNVVSVEHDRPSKNKQVMVIYLNRLLCPGFGLPLGRGGFREKKLEVMARWMLDPVEGAFLNDPPEQLSF